MNWLDSIAIGLKGILVNKLRSLLSTLGIMFGVGAVVAMMSVGEGAKQEAVEQIKLLGTNNIRIKHLTLTGENWSKARRIYSRGLTYRDAVLLRDSLPGLIKVSALKFSAITCSNGTGLSSAASVIGLWESDTEMPLRTSPAACRSFAGVIRLSAPISSSSPHRFQLESSLNIRSNWAAVVGARSGAPSCVSATVNWLAPMNRMTAIAGPTASNLRLMFCSSIPSLLTVLVISRWRVW